MMGCMRDRFEASAPSRRGAARGAVGVPDQPDRHGPRHRDHAAVVHARGGVRPAHRTGPPERAHRRPPGHGPCAVPRGCGRTAPRAGLRPRPAPGRARLGVVAVPQPGRRDDVLRRAGSSGSTWPIRSASGPRPRSPARGRSTSSCCRPCPGLSRGAHAAQPLSRRRHSAAAPRSARSPGAQRWRLAAPGRRRIEALGRPRARPRAQYPSDPGHPTPATLA